MLMYKGYLRSLVVGMNTELIMPMFRIIKKHIMGITTVSMKIGNRFPTFISIEVYFFVTTK